MELQVIKLEVVEETIAVVRFANPPVNAHSQQLLTEVESPLLNATLATLATLAT